MKISTSKLVPSSFQAPFQAPFQAQPTVSALRMMFAAVMNWCEITHEPGISTDSSAPKIEPSLEHQALICGLCRHLCVDAMVLNNGIMSLQSCGHIFCQSCIQLHLKTDCTCPMCGMFCVTDMLVPLQMCEPATIFLHCARVATRSKVLRSRSMSLVNTKTGTLWQMPVISLEHGELLARTPRSTLLPTGSFLVKLSLKTLRRLRVCACSRRQPGSGGHSALSPTSSSATFVLRAEEENTPDFVKFIKL